MANLLQPQRTRWKRRLLIIVYAPFPVLVAIHLIIYESYYFFLFGAGYFLLMTKRSARLPVFAATLGVVVWLWSASFAQALGGTWLVAAVTALLLVVWLQAARKKVFRILFHSPEDIFVHFFLICLAHLTWFFFIPAPYPGAWIAGQRGVDCMADSYTHGAFRRVSLLNQFNLAAEWPDGSLVLTTKRSALDDRPDYRLFFFDQHTGALREEISDRILTTEQLVECPPGRPITQPNVARDSTIGLFGKPDRPNWRGAEKGGYCLMETGLLLLSDERQIIFTDLETGEEVHRQDVPGTFPKDSIRFFAPYGPGKLATLQNEFLTLIRYDRINRKLKWKIKKSFTRRLEGESRMLGDESYPYVYFVDAVGQVERIEPEAGAVMARGKILPGFRFAVFEPRLRLLYVVNDLLGVLEVLDGEDLRRLDRLYVGHAARRFNPAREERGIGYLVSSAGIFRLDICARLPDTCHKRPVVESE